MSTTAADTLTALKQPLESKELVLSIPGLAWQLPRIEEAVANIELAIRESPTNIEAVVEQHRVEALGHDRAFDIGQRYVVRAFELALVEVEGSERKTVIDAQARLLPLGLQATQLSFLQEASYVETQALQSKRDDVLAGLTIVAAHAPRVVSQLEKAVDAGRALGKSLDAAAKVLAGNTAGNALFEARRSALAVLAHFRDTVTQLYPAGTPTNDTTREQLIGRYERLLAALLDAAKNAKPQTPAPPAA